MIPTSDPNEGMSKNEIIEQRTVEMQVSRRLLAAIRDRLRAKFGSTDAKESKFRLEPFEEKVLTNINNSGILEGVAAGLLSLFALRRVRAMVFARAVQKSQQASRSPMESMIEQQRSNEIPNNPFQNPNMPGGGSFQQEPKLSKAAHAFGWVMDLMLSVATMITVADFARDSDSLVTEVSKIPLAPGYSTISREFCPIAISWLQELQGESQRGNRTVGRILQHPIDKTTQAYLDFARNCQLRTRYENKLRADKGVKSPDYPVAIPSPGVPTDSESLDDSAPLSSVTWDDGEQSFSTDDGFSESSTTNWGDDFVQDQENDGRRS